MLLWKVQILQRREDALLVNHWQLLCVSMWGKTREKTERRLFRCLGASSQAAAEMELGCSTRVSSEHPGNRRTKQGLADGVGGGKAGRQGTGASWRIYACSRERD